MVCEGEECNLCDFPIQKAEQKKEQILLLKGILHSCNTSFKECSCEWITLKAIYWEYQT